MSTRDKLTSPCHMTDGRFWDLQVPARERKDQIRS